MTPAPATDVISPMHVAADTVHTPSRDAEMVLLVRVIESAAVAAALTVTADASMRAANARPEGGMCSDRYRANCRLLIHHHILHRAPMMIPAGIQTRRVGRCR